MSRLRNRSALIGFVVCCLLVFDGWALWQWASSQQLLDSDQDRLAAANRLARSIESLRRSPEKLDANARSADSLAKLIESAAQQVGLGTDRIVHVAPSEPRRVGNTPYLEQVTAVELRDVSVKQLVDLTRSLGEIAPRLTIPSISMRTPANEANSAGKAELWNVELTLTGHLYEPKMPSSP
jgi:hypothetical protein